MQPSTAQAPEGVTKAAANGKGAVFPALRVGKRGGNNAANPQATERPVLAQTQHPDPESLCCVSMQAALEMQCETHSDPFECPDSLIAYHEGLKQFALIIHDGDRNVVVIRHCPWCGAALSEAA